MKRYAIFGGMCFYARGGFNDLLDHADDLDNARTMATAIAEQSPGYCGVDWWQIVDLESGEIVDRSVDALSGKVVTPLGGDDHEAEPYHRKFVNGDLVPFERHEL